MRFRISMLLIANLLGVVIVLYFMDMLGVNEWYSSLKRFVTRQKATTYTYDAESRQYDLSLLEQAEQKKLMESMLVKELMLSNKEANLKSEMETLTQERNLLKAEREEFEQRQAQSALEDRQQKTYKRKVLGLANTFYNMPPDKATERLVGLEDDLLILDILKEMESLAEQNEQLSIVPYLYSLMPKEVAARLLKKASISLQ